MQEEIDDRTVNLCITATRLSARMIISAVRKLHQMDQQNKAREAAEETSPVRGKQTVKQLIGQGENVSNVEISKTGLKDFERIARKYGVDFAIRKSDERPPRYYVFFKARDAGAINAAVEEYASVSMNKGAKPSVLEQLRKLKDVIAKIPVKVRKQQKER